MCFHYEPRKKETKNTEVKTNISKFQVGDKVKITRKANSRENGWNNIWISDMDSAVGKVGTVTEVTQWGIGVNVPGIRGFYQYPEFVLEVASKHGFEIGERVRVTAKRGGPYVGVPATVKSFDTEYVHILPDGNKFVVSYFPYNLEKLPAPKDVYSAAKEIAIAIAQHGTVTADKVQEKLIAQGYTPGQLGNAAGALFRGKNWRKVGEVPSTRPSNRGRKVSEWELVNA